MYVLFALVWLILERLGLRGVVNGHPGERHALGFWHEFDILTVPNLSGAFIHNLVPLRRHTRDTAKP